MEVKETLQQVEQTMVRVDIAINKISKDLIYRMEDLPDGEVKERLKRLLFNLHKDFIKLLSDLLERLNQGGEL